MALRHVSSWNCPTPLKSPSRNCGGLFIYKHFPIGLKTYLRELLVPQALTAQVGASLGDLERFEFICNGLTGIFNSTYQK